MGVIAPEHKKKRRVENNGFSIFIFLLFVIGIPFLVIKSCVSHAMNPVTIEVDGKELAASGGKYTKDRKGLYDLNGPVMDTAGILSSKEYNELDVFLRDLDKNTGVQIVVLTVKSLNGDSIEEFSINHAQKWQLGYKGVDNGVLLTVAMDEHDVRIETGYGTEGTLTDAKCARIIRNVIIPSFRNDDYAEGITQGVMNIAGIITGDESLLSPSVNKDYEASSENEMEDPLELVFAFAIVLFVIIFSILINAAGMGRRRRRGGIYISPGSFGGASGNHHSSNSFGGGSSFHGGGGSFGGGGASGHW